MNSIPNFQSGKVLVIGDIMLDRYWSGPCSRISPEAPVPVVNVKHVEDRLGGAANVAHNIRALGCQTTLCGTIGKDAAGDTIKASLDALAINHHLSVDEQHPTTTKLRVLSQHQQLIRLDFEEKQQAREQTTSLSVLEKIIEGHDVVVLSDYAKGTVVSPEGIIAICNRLNIRVLVDPKGSDFSRYANSTLITPNKKELENVVGPTENLDELFSKAEKLRRSLKLQAFMVTLGENGIALMEEGKPPAHIATRAQDVFDVTGAGDTVIACLAASMACDLNLNSAMQLANVAAGIVVGKIGTATVSANELQQAMRIHSKSPAIKTLSEIRALVREAKKNNEKIVFTNGCFDLLHAGHVDCLQQAAQLGDKLVVALNSDSSVRNLKGNDRPIMDLDSRAEVISALRDVDWVTSFDEETPIKLIETLGPDVLVKGGDYKEKEIVGYNAVTENGGLVVVIPIKAGFSTTAIVDKIKR